MLNQKLFAIVGYFLFKFCVGLWI